MNTVASLVRQLEELLEMKKVKPYLPYWGPIYGVLYQIRKLGKQKKQDLFVYEMSSYSQVVYEYKKDRFCMMMQEVNVYLTDQELTDAIAAGRFYPKSASSKEPMIV